jgi:IclR family acetate operon transcriptional repressor
MTSMRTAGWTDSVSVLDRITAVFESFGETEEGLGVTEVARRANLPKSTVSRIAADLVDQRLLDRDGDTLYLGVRLFELGQTVEQPRRLRVLAHPAMAELRNVTGGLTVHLALLEDSDVVLLSAVHGRADTSPHAIVGGRLPAHATALGKVLLAFSPSDRDLRRVLERGLVRCTPQTICDPGELARELREVRSRGVAFEREECVTGRTCTASAILSLGSVPVAAIAVAGPPAAVADDHVAAAVRSSAISLGHRIDARREL